MVHRRRAGGKDEGVGRNAVWSSRDFVSGNCIVKNPFFLCIYNARSYLKNLIADADTKQLFSMVKSLSSPNQSSILPDHSSDSELANRFARFFSEKVSNVVSSFTDSDQFRCQQSHLPLLHLIMNFPNSFLNLLRKSRSSSNHYHLNTVNWIHSYVAIVLRPCPGIN